MSKIEIIGIITMIISTLVFFVGAPVFVWRERRENKRRLER